MIYVHFLWQFPVFFLYSFYKSNYGGSRRGFFELILLGFAELLESCVFYWIYFLLIFLYFMFFLFLVFSHNLMRLCFYIFFNLFFFSLLSRLDNLQWFIHKLTDSYLCHFYSAIKLIQWIINFQLLYSFSYKICIWLFIFSISMLIFSVFPYVWSVLTLTSWSMVIIVALKLSDKCYICVIPGLASID